MRTKHLLPIYLAVLILATTVYGQNKSAKDYLGVPGPIKFDKISYNLTWTSHPADNFYKQEYMAAGENVEKFKTLILIDYVTVNSGIKDVVGAKIAELKKMKETNPVVNYEIFENKGEYMLDFLLSENTPDGKVISIVERNVYRYKTVNDKSGKKGVLLFGVSKRSYGNDVDKFFASLKTQKTNLVNSVSTFEMPELGIVK